MLTKTFKLLFIGLGLSLVGFGCQPKQPITQKTTSETQPVLNLEAMQAAKPLIVEYTTVTSAAEKTRDGVVVPCSGSYHYPLVRSHGLESTILSKINQELIAFTASPYDSPETATALAVGPCVVKKNPDDGKKDVNKAWRTSVDVEVTQNDFGILSVVKNTHSSNGERSGDVFVSAIFDTTTGNRLSVLDIVRSDRVIELARRLAVALASPDTNTGKIGDDYISQALLEKTNQGKTLSQAAATAYLKEQNDFISLTPDALRFTHEGYCGACGDVVVNFSRAELGDILLIPMQNP